MTPEPDRRDLWPDAETLAAGDEELIVPEIDDDWPRARPFQEDGHLAASDWRRRHPDEN